MSTAERIRLPDDCTIGYIVEALLGVPLVRCGLFHSHLENLQQVPASELHEQVPFRPLPPVPGHALVPPLCHLLAAVAETPSPGAPGIQRARGPLSCHPGLGLRGHPGAAPVCVLCAHPCSRLLGSSALPRGRQSPACLSTFHPGRICMSEITLRTVLLPFQGLWAAWGPGAALQGRVGTTPSC